MPTIAYAGVHEADLLMQHSQLPGNSQVPRTRRPVVKKQDLHAMNAELDVSYEQHQVNNHALSCACTSGCKR